MPRRRQGRRELRGLTLPTHDTVTRSPADRWLGRFLGDRTVSWTERDPILFALAVGATPERLDLVLERGLRVLPPFALTLAHWAPGVLARGGAFDTASTMHGGQRLEVLAPLPARGTLTMSARVSAVWDKGSAAVYEVTVESDAFVATWSLVAAGRGGFGGARGPTRPRPVTEIPAVTTPLRLAENAAVLYRLLADRHPLHVDPTVAARYGHPRPVLHGLATLASSTLVLADQVGAHPADLTSLEARFATPALPGEVLDVRRFDGRRFEVATTRGNAVESGTITFG